MMDFPASTSRFQATLPTAPALEVLEAYKPQDGSKGAPCHVGINSRIKS